MPNSVPWYKRYRLFLIIGAVVAVLVVAGSVVGLVVTQAAPPQPFPYTHAPHIEAGIACLYCHPGANRGVAAGLPTKDRCEGCHNNMAADTQGLKDLATYLNENEQLEWVPVAMQPDFVYFSHQPHVAAGLNCENCHGNVGAMADAEPQRGHNMGWCLGCHKELAPEKFVKLSDCATCHK